MKHFYGQLLKLLLSFVDDAEENKFLADNDGTAKKRGLSFSKLFELCIMLNQLLFVT